MEPSRHLDLLRFEGNRLAAMPVDALDAPVPTLPDWTVERVVRHVGRVHRWVVGALAVGPDEEAPAAEPLPKGPDCLPAYAESLTAVIEVLRSTPPDAEAWTFVGPSPAAFWMRRQAHEVAVHRIDAADAVHAAGGPEPEPLDPDGAFDAVAEWAEVFLATRFTQRFGDLPAGLHGRTVDLVATGSDVIRLGLQPSGTTVDHGPRPEDGPADATVTGDPADLLLVLWRRRPLDSVRITGDRPTVTELLDAAHF
ncbi:MAG: maleylpyruvate isomerase family mycothiol-dependent enzyme [Acidimicrobiales bacterium]|nr:maleylpyruvate isomerase family mycothiol-dependent enzyme [Acidimicrobiales bacterium]